MEEPDGPELGASLLSAYVSTLVTGPDGRTWSGPEAIEALPYAACWVITGWNPFSEKASDAHNEEANARLLETIRAQGTDVTPVSGCAPDHTWCEPAFALPGSVPRDVVCRWARDFDQHAVFHLTAREHLVVHAGTERTVGSRPRVTPGREAGSLPC